MKKIILFIIILITISGCSKKIGVEIYTNISENDNETISINYPLFNIKKLNKIIKKDINKIITDFTDFKNISIKNIDDKKELNIDYTYNIINKDIISTSIIVYNSFNNETSENIYTYLFSINKNKLLELNDITDNLDSIKNIITNKFIIDNNYLTFYSINNNKVISNKISLNQLKLKFNINIDNIVNENYNFIPTNKVIDPSKPVIALTFDDGPSKYTNKIIELLKEYDCNATFFVLGNKVEHYKNTIQTSIKNGNEIGNHTFNHKWLSRLNVDSIKWQIESTQDIINKLANYKVRLLRPTYGSVNKKIRNSTDLDIILWNVDTMDWKIKDSKKIASRAIPTIKDGSIILMHDTYERTYKALKIIIPKLKEKNFQFVTVSELKEIQAIREKYV